MRTPLLIDTRNVLDPADARDAGKRLFRWSPDWNAPADTSAPISSIIGLSPCWRIRKGLILNKADRIRYWGYVATLGKYLRVVTLADGETFHNAFPDRRYRGTGKP
jgi:hypothetical protein